MAMGFGKMRKKFTKETIEWTKKKELEYTNGSVSKYTKDNSRMTLEKAMENFIASANWGKKPCFIRVAGPRVRNGNKASLMRLKLKNYTPFLMKVLKSRKNYNS